MKRTLILAICLFLLGLAAGFSRTTALTTKVTLRLTDSATGKVLPGLIRILDRDGQPIAVMSAANDDGKSTRLISRGLGLADQPAIDRWTVVPHEVQLVLPRDTVQIEAFSGLDTELNRKTLNLTGLESSDVAIPLVRFYDAAEQGLRSANTHLHLMKLSREQADQYLTEVPRADGLDVLFVSYLERAEVDRDYISNRYSRADLEKLGQQSGTVFGNGEEHRHNFQSKGTGYGHVMLLDNPRLIQPVSIGPGITKTGTDGLPLQRGIDQARRDGATIVWCHNNMGIERIVNQVTGRLHAQNIFDGGSHGSFKDSFYRALNSGLKAPFATGTDWFMYDFSRTYVKVDGPLTTDSWLKGLSAGRSYITNGPFLEFRIAGQGPGATVSLDKLGTVSVEARGIGRIDFQRIELVQNGTVIRSQSSRAVNGHFVAELRFDLPIDAPCWLALRIPPPPVPNDPEMQTAVPRNEYGQPLFAHTSAIGIDLGGRSRFDRATALGLLAEMRAALRAIDDQGIFADDSEKARVVDVYHDAIASFERKLDGTRDQ